MVTRSLTLTNVPRLGMGGAGLWQSSLWMDEGDLAAARGPTQK